MTRRFPSATAQAPTDPIAAGQPALAGAWRALRRLGESTLDLLLPPTCSACDAPVLRQGTLCSACFQQMQFIADPCCDGCGMPFAAEALAGPERRCQQCQDAPPLFRSARAAFVYGEGVRHLILPLKHGDQPALADVLAPRMAHAGAALLRDHPLLVPVPLHRMRLFRRRYNQAALLAWAIGKLTGCPVCPDALRRTRATPSLDHRGAEERRLAVAGAFDARPSRVPAIAGQRVVLVDDVMTSGATANACAAVLLAAGAMSVDVLVAARVPLGPGVFRPATGSANDGVTAD